MCLWVDMPAYTVFMYTYPGLLENTDENSSANMRLINLYWFKWLIFVNNIYDSSIYQDLKLQFKMKIVSYWHGVSLFRCALQSSKKSRVSEGNLSLIFYLN